MAVLPVPRAELNAPAPAATDGRVVGPRVPGPVLELLDTLWSGGHAAYVVGGSLRDVLLGREPYNWDLTTDAVPERVIETLSR